MHLQSFKTLTQPLPAHRVPLTALCRRLCIQQAKDFKQKPLHPAELSPRKRKSKYGAKPSKIWHCKELWPRIRRIRPPDGKLMRICARIPTHAERRLPRSKRSRHDSLHASPTTVISPTRQAALFILSCTFRTDRAKRAAPLVLKPKYLVQISAATHHVSTLPCCQKSKPAKDALPLPGILRPFFKNPT